jgi:hypothetical protein
MSSRRYWTSLVFMLAILSFCYGDIERSLVVLRFFPFKWPFTLQFAGWQNDLNNCFSLDHFHFSSSNNYLASLLSSSVRVCTKNFEEEEISWGFFSYRFSLQSKSSKHSGVNFSFSRSVATYTAVCISSLSFTDKLDSTRMENFVHKSPHIYDLFSVSALNIYHRRY